MTMASDHQPTTSTGPSAAAPRTGRHRLGDPGTQHVARLAGIQLPPRSRRPQPRLVQLFIRGGRP